jgi:hypothetical protein
MNIQPARAAIRILVVVFTLTFPLLAVAQSERRGQIYVFGTAGSFDEAEGFNLGGGVGFEKLFYKGLGAGAELEGFWGPGSDGYGGLVFSANPSYHFKTSGSKLVPFVTGGFSAIGICGGGFFLCGGTGGFNLGGGIHYWTSPKRGLRMEFRDHVFNPGSDGVQKLEMRIGLAF